MKSVRKISTPGVLGEALPKLTPQKAGQLLMAQWRAEVIEAFGPACRQLKTVRRILDVVTGILFTEGRGTLTNSIRARGLDQEDWTNDYRVFNEDFFDPHALFQGVCRATLPLLKDPKYVLLALDDTGLPKVGPTMAFTRWCHNPLCPPWEHPALMWAHPCFHAALLVPGESTCKTTAITVAFEPVEGLGKKTMDKLLAAALAKLQALAPQPPPKKKRAKRKSKAGRGKQGGARKRPNKKVSKSGKKLGRPTKEVAALKKEAEKILRQRYPAAPDVAVETIRRVRRWLDEAGQQDRILIVVGDGSYTNATVFENLDDRCVYVGRTRPDASLAWVGRTTPGGFAYGEKGVKPIKLAQDERYPHKRGRFVYGGDVRELRFKSFGPLCRPTSTNKKQLRLLTLLPTPYKQNGKRRYTHRAFLLTSDLEVPNEVLIQAYLYRWQIEVLHRDLKSEVRVGKAQVRTTISVKRAHSAVVAAYALLWVTALKLFGNTRVPCYFPQAKWQRNLLAFRSADRVKRGKQPIVPRPSAQDVLTLFRNAHFQGWSAGKARCAVLRKPREKNRVA